MVQFYPWFKFYFPLFYIHYHTLPYPKTKGNKIFTKDKIEPQLMDTTEVTTPFPPPQGVNFASGVL